LSNSSYVPARQLVPVWLAIGIVFALLAGAGAGYLAYLSKNNIPTAILKGFGAFAATLTLEILVIGLVVTSLPSEPTEREAAET
jgi:hypothetical protein